MKFFVIGDEETVLGFKLAGVEGKVISDKEELLNEIKNLMESGKYGVIIITTQLVNKIRDYVEELMFKSSFPLILEIPDRKSLDTYGINVREIIRKTVGIKV